MFLIGNTNRTDSNAQCKLRTSTGPLSLSLYIYTHHCYSVTSATTDVAATVDNTTYVQYPRHAPSVT